MPLFFLGGRRRRLALVAVVVLCGLLSGAELPWVDAATCVLVRNLPARHRVLGLFVVHCLAAITSEVMPRVAALHALSSVLRCLVLLL